MPQGKAGAALLFYAGMRGAIAVLGVLAASLNSSVVGCTAAKGEEDCSARAVEVSAVWNARARASYLARAGSGADAADDVRWFEDYARRLGHARVEACKAERRSRTPQLTERSACLERGLADLRVALARTSVQWWPHLQDLAPCEGRKGTELSLGGERYPVLMSPGGDRLLAKKSDGWFLIEGDGSKRVAELELDTQVLRWLAGERLVVRRKGVVEVLELGTGQSRRIASSTQILDVSPDLRYAAVATSKAVELALLDDLGLRLTGVSLAVPNASVQALFSPGGGKLAVFSYTWRKFLILELKSRRMASLSHRAHSSSTGYTPFDWLDDDSLITTGSVENAVRGEAWVLKLGADLSLARGPRPLFVAEPGSALVVEAAARGAVVLSRSLTLPRSGVVEGGALVERPELRGYQPRAYNSTTEELLYERDLQYVERQRDGTLRPLPIASGLERHFFEYFRGELVGIGQRKGDVYLLDRRGGALRLELASPREGSLVGLRCARERCVVGFVANRQLHLLALPRERGILTTQIALLPLDGGFSNWTISHDLSKVAISTHNPFISIFDLRGGSRHVEEQACDFAEWLAFSKGGDSLFYSCAQIDAQKWQIRELSLGGTERGSRRLLETDEWISGLVLNYAGQIFVSSVGWESSSLIVKQARGESD